MIEKIPPDLGDNAGAAFDICQIAAGNWQKKQKKVLKIFPKKIFISK
ncbi:hypothetical protein ACFLRB_02800 [Acidobacteriota bacterium]